MKPKVSGHCSDGLVFATRPARDETEEKSPRIRDPLKDLEAKTDLENNTSGKECRHGGMFYSYCTLMTEPFIELGLSPAVELSATTSAALRRELMSPASLLVYISTVPLISLLITIFSGMI